MKKHRTVLGLVAALAGIALLLGGVATASNMGFKFVPQIPGTTNANCYNLSIPWNNNYTDAQSLLVDIQGTGTKPTRVAKMESDTKLTSWYGDDGVNFSIAKGEAYLVFGATGGHTPVVVGSHDPNFTFNFVSGQAFNASAPYHQTFTDAQGLLADLRAKAGGAPTSFPRVAMFETSAKLTSWYGDDGVNFPLSLGMGVVIFPATNLNGYVWPHY